ncbi:MAG: hypothetical protein ACHBN1_12935 [Heteroscytonema crispum UTEX LB 1556]
MLDSDAQIRDELSDRHFFSSGIREVVLLDCGIGPDERFTIIQRDSWRPFN